MAITNKKILREERFGKVISTKKGGKDRVHRWKVRGAIIEEILRQSNNS